jgi:hypothetical protein
MYSVVIKRKLERNIQKLPRNVQVLFIVLRDELAEEGPIQPEWKNYGILSEGSYHCHLGLHHAACWRCEKKSIVIEVTYVGSRESAPY